MKILVLGGRGFVGSAVVAALQTAPKYEVFTFDREPDSEHHFQGSILSLVDLKRAMKGMDVVINLVGLSPLRKPKTSYEKVHVEGAKNVVKACKNMKVKRLIHMSVLPERLPSVIFDKNNELVQMAKRFAWALFFPKIKAKIQPIYRGDIASLFVLAVEGRIKEKKVELAGEDAMGIFEFVRNIRSKMGYPCFGIPIVFLKPFMYVLAFFKLFGFSKDQIKSLSLDNLPHENMATKYVKLTRFDGWLGKSSF